MKKFLVMTAAALLATTTMVSAATLNVVNAGFARATVTGPASVKYTLLSSADPLSAFIGSAIFDGSTSPDGSTFSSIVLQGAGTTSFLGFVYAANGVGATGSLLNLFGVASGSASVVYTILSATSLRADFENGAAAGVDMSVQIDVSEVPVPAAGLLLLSGLGGLGLMRRRRNKA